METWALESIEQLISNQVQEHLNLEYKRADALRKGKEDEITKDVSAMANSDGGVIIYGIKETGKEDEAKLPEGMDPINHAEFSRERLDQIINNIRPKIDGIIITPVLVNEKQVIYVVDIPKSDTAHQAKDYRYHKRTNFTTHRMEDYEIRDVMNRNKNPKFKVCFEIIETNLKYTLNVKIKNTGSVCAHYVYAYICLPKQYADTNAIIIDKNTKMVQGVTTSFLDNVLYYEYHLDNTAFGQMKEESIGTGRFNPIPPGLTRKWVIPLVSLKNQINNDLFTGEGTIRWRIFADNAPVFAGAIALRKIKIYKRELPHAHF